jgi:hypothetical protein
MSYSNLALYILESILLGHEEIWHGFIDIIFSSHTGKQECIAMAQIPRVSSEMSPQAVPSQSSPDADLESSTPMKKTRTEDNSDSTCMYIFLTV